MKVVLAGASGHLGTLLTRWFQPSHQVIGISRSSGVIWDGHSMGDWAACLEGADLLVNLAGRSVNCRYSEVNRREIFESRVWSTRVLAQAAAGCRVPPRVWLNSSTATIYRHAEDRPQDEDHGELGHGFSVEVARAWEAEFFDHEVPGVRKVALRSAMAMAAGKGGPFEVLENLMKAGVGRLGSGTQRMSWIHGDDFCRAIDFLAFRSNMAGVVNVSAPMAPTNREFFEVLRQSDGRRISFPVPEWAVQLGAFLMGTEAELPLKSRWVVPSRLVAEGFEFKHPDWRSAAHDLVQRDASKPAV